MKRWACALAVLAFTIALAIMPAGAQDQKTPTIKQVMGKLHKGKDALIIGLKKNWTPISRTGRKFSK